MAAVKTSLHLKAVTKKTQIQVSTSMCYRGWVYIFDSVLPRASSEIFLGKFGVQKLQYNNVSQTILTAN